MRKIIHLIVLLIFVQVSFSQSVKEQLALINSVNIEATDFYEEIPFKNKFGYFIIPVQIGKDSYEYIFDTGGFNTITSEIMEENRLSEFMKVEVGSANQLKSKIALTKVPAVEIAGIDFIEIGAFNFDFENSPQIKCYTNGGLIGKSVIKSAVWQINASKEIIILTDDIDKLGDLDDSFQLKVSLDKLNNPFVKAKVNGKTMPFLLDFGYGGFISLTEIVGEQLSASNKTEIIGEGSVSANGIVNESMFIKPIEELKIGNTSFKKEVAYYSKSNNYNLIGTEITKHFIVTLNLNEKELFLTPIQNHETNIPKMTFGFNLNRKDNKMYVNKLYKNGSAENVGLKLNDKVLSINGKDFINKTYCDFYDATTSLLRATEPITLKIQRRDEILLFEINKKEVLNAQ